MLKLLSLSVFPFTWHVPKWKDFGSQPTVRGSPQEWMSLQRVGRGHTAARGGFLLHFPRSWGWADESDNYRGACSVCVPSHITWQGKTRYGQTGFCWASEGGCCIFKDITCMFHPHFYKNFAMLLGCGGEGWKRFYLPLEEMFCAVVVPELTRGDSCPKGCG